MLPHGVIALSISTVILPTLARFWQQGDQAAFRATLGGAVRTLFFLSLPASVVLFAFRTPIVQTLFQTGAFSAESTALVAAPLAYLAAGLVSYALVEAFTRAYYAMHDTRTPVIVGISVIALNLGLGVSLLDRMGYLALAFSLSASTTVEAVVLAAILMRRLGGLPAAAFAWTARVIAASDGDSHRRRRPGLAVERGHYAQALSPRVLQFAVFILALGVVGVVFVASAWIVQLPELFTTFEKVTNRMAPLRGYWSA